MKPEIIIAIVVALLFTINFNRAGEAKSSCVKAFGPGTMTYSRSVLGLRCMLPDGTVRNLQ